MRQLISEITDQIVEHIRINEINMIRLECFDDPIIYESVCRNLENETRLGNIVLIPKITLEKYNQFSASNNSFWSQSLIYLHKGKNPQYNPSYENDLESDNEYAANSFVDFNKAITRWRNESSNISSDVTCLILLMGTEAAPDDSGSLKDTTFLISPSEMVKKLSKDYSSWFRKVLVNNSIDSEETRNAIHTLYRTIFSKINLNIFQFSRFIDSLDSVQFSNAQELINHICETLNINWGIPSILDPKYIPKVHNLSAGKIKEARIVSSGIDFIKREDDIPTESGLSKIEAKFSKYADSKQLDVSVPFPEENSQFDNFDDFKQCVLDFKCGININSNREKLLKVDYAIIYQILGTKLPKKQSEGAVIVTGEPMEAYMKMFLDVADKYYTQYNSYPVQYSVGIEKISLSDCINDQKLDSFMSICIFVGGILNLFNDAEISYSGVPVEFEYNNQEDPFVYDNHNALKDYIHCTGKWGELSKIEFNITARGHIENEEIEHRYEYKWSFSPNSSWLNAFTIIRTSMFNTNKNSYAVPTMVICDNMQDYLSCESEEEFYAKLTRINIRILDQGHRKEVERYFKGTVVYEDFIMLCKEFRDFSIGLIDKGLYSALPLLRRVVKTYTNMMDHIHDDYSSFNDQQKEKVGLLLNCFVITSNTDVLEDCKMDEVLLPAYNPVMLEKIDAKQVFLRDGFAEILSSIMNEKLSKSTVSAKLDKLIQLSSITHGMDIIYQNSSKYLTRRNMWEYFGVYFNDANIPSLLSDNSFISTIVTEDDNTPALLRFTPLSNVVIRNIKDYIRTFPARVDGLNIAFIDPPDMQHIVVAIHSVAKELEKSNIHATINLMIICSNNKKNSASYLRKWLDSYFDNDRSITVNTFLRNVILSSQSDTSKLNVLINGYDICFNYEILTPVDIKFDNTGEEIISKEQAKFPMTFTPDTIPATHGKSRKVSISQFQFLAAKSHTQASYVAGSPNSKPGTYRVYKVLEINDIQKSIIEKCHDSCKWVICIDQAVDRGMLESSNSRIIGFTTGEGSYGELNVTVSARNDILNDIKLLLERRIKEKFPYWSNDRLQLATDFCVDEMTKYMDGSRILKALNPYDYEIHNFLAYILTIQILGLSKKNDSFAIRVLLSLDSYKHWFSDSYEDNMRPDFMLIEIPITENNLNPGSCLELQIKIIECKMGNQSTYQLEKAQQQLEKGIQTLSINWNPNNNSIMHRYWLNQLYRAIIFSPLNMDDTANEYNIIRNKIYGILNGNYKIKWSGDIYAFWLDSNLEEPYEWDIESDLPVKLEALKIELGEMKCHCYGQIFIQKMLVPPKERTAEFVVYTSENQQNRDDGTYPHDYDDNNANDASSIPSTREIYLPFLEYLNDGRKHTRTESLNWFEKYFSIEPKDKLLRYDSNGHLKWETALDEIITLFRKVGLIENSIEATFYLTDLGIGFAKEANSLLLNNSFQKAVDEYISKQDSYNRLNHTHEDERQKAENSNGNDKHSDDSISTSDEFTAKKSLNDIRFFLGTDLKTGEKYYWEFGNKNLNNRHLLINGNSGCGKTYCIQGLLMEMVQAGVSGVVFDYTGGFTSDKLDPVFREVLGDKIQERFVFTNGIPMNPFLKQTVKTGGKETPEPDPVLAMRIANVFATVYNFGAQQTSALYKAIKNGLKKHNESMSFSYLEAELNDVNQKQAGTVLSKIQPFLDMNPFVDDENFYWGDIRDSGGMVYIMQLDGYDRSTQLLLTELLLWDIWNYCVKNGDENHPFVIVMDEAQNLSHAEDSPSGKFLTEGRKFGISAWYATQFMKPQLTDDEIQRLQQAGQKLYFCPPDDGVMTVAKSIDINSQETKSWASRLKSLKKGECVTCGNMLKNNKWIKYDPHVIKVPSLKERLTND